MNPPATKTSAISQTKPCRIRAPMQGVLAASRPKACAPDDTARPKSRSDHVIRRQPAFRPVSLDLDRGVLDAEPVMQLLADARDEGVVVLCRRHDQVARQRR